MFAPPLRQGGNGPETWVAILGPVVTAVNIDVPFERMAVAASTRIDGIEVVVYGSVLPWNAAPTQAPMHALAGESSEKMFARTLAEQEADVRALQSAFPPALIIWAGNFNQSFTGPNFGGNNRKRSLLVSSLERLEMSAWNTNAPHAKEGMCAIDLICGPADLEVTVERVSTVHDHVVLSDHAGYVANVQLPAELITR